MAGLSTGAGAPVVKVYHEKSMILPDVSRVLACLYEKDVKFETVKASYKNILTLQAARSVPVPFYDGPTFLQDSRAICRYIAETYKQRGYPFLLGKDVLERASIEQWLRNEEHAFDPPSRALFCHLAFPLYYEDSDDINREKRKLEEVLEVYEQRLGESEFLAGNKFTLADLVHLPNTHHIVTSEKFAYLYDSRKNVQRWWKTISTRDSWQQVARDMESVEEQYQMEELEQQEMLQHQQWQTQPLPTSGGRIIRIDPRKQGGSESRTILVPPPSGGNISTSLFSSPQEEQPLPAETSSQNEPSPVQKIESNFFSAPEKIQQPPKQRSSTAQKSSSSSRTTASTFFTPAISPNTTNMTQGTHTDKSTSRDASSPTTPSQRSSKETPDKLHVSDFYKARSHPDEAVTLGQSTPHEASKTSDRLYEARETGEAITPDKPIPGAAKAPHEMAPDKPAQKSPSSVQSTRSTFFNPAIPPTTTEMPQRTDTDKSTSKDISYPIRPNQRSSREAPDFYKTSSHPAEAATPTKPVPQKALKTTDRVHEARQTSEAVTPEKPSRASAKVPSKIDEVDLYETESKPTSVNPLVDQSVPYTEPDSKIARGPYTRLDSQRAADTSGPAASETPYDQRSIVRTPYAQQRPEQARKASPDQQAAAQSPDVAAKDFQGVTAPESSIRGSPKEAREAGPKRTTSAPTQELSSGTQNIPQEQSKAPLTDLKVSDLSTLQAEFEESQGTMNGDERFSTKRLRKMLAQSEATAVKPQSTDLQATPEQEETPSIYNKPSDVQDRIRKPSNILPHGKTDGTPSTRTRAPDTPTSADEWRGTSPQKGGMSDGDRGVTEPGKSPSTYEKQPARPVPTQSPTTSARRASASSNGVVQDDDLPRLPTIDQWRLTSTPSSPIQKVAPGAPSIGRLGKTARVDRTAPPSTPDQASFEQSDKITKDEREPEMTSRQAPPSDTRQTSASIQEAIQGTRGPGDMFGDTSGTDQMATKVASKQIPAQRVAPDARDTGDEKTVIGKGAAPTVTSQEPVLSSRQTELVKGASPTSHGSTADEPADIRMTDESALKSRSTDLQAPSEQEETPSFYKKPVDVQDRKRQPGNLLEDGKTDGPPSTRTRAPDTPTSADRRRATSPLKARMDDGDRGATEPRKSPSTNEQQPAPPVPTQSPNTSARRASASSNGVAQDDDLAQLSTIDQWRHTSTPPIQKIAPGASSTDRLGKTAGVDRRAPPSTPDQTSIEQSDQSTKDEREPELTPRQAHPSDTRQTSASIQEAIQGSRVPNDDMLGETSDTDQMTTKVASKQTPAQGVAPDARDSGDEKLVSGKKAATTSQEPALSSRQTEPVKGVNPTSYGSTADQPAGIRMAHRSATPSALKSRSTDLQAPSEQEETPSIYKKPADVQDSKMQPVHNLDDGKSDGPPSTRTRDTDTLTSAEERRGKSPPKGSMADDDRGATEPRKSPSANEQLPAPPVPTQSPTTSASASSNGLSQDDDLAQLSTIDQWRRTSTPLSPIQEVAPGAPSIDRLGKTVGIDRTAPPSTPDQTLYEQSDKSSKDERTPKMTRRQAPLSDTRQTSASIQETILGARGPSDDMFGETSNTDQMTTKITSKQTPAQGVAPDAGDSGDEKPVVGKKAAPTLTSQGPVSGSRQTEPVTGVSPTSRGSTEDESDDSAISPAPLQPPASDGRSASTAIQEGIHDGHRKNEAVKPPISGPSGRPTTTRGLEATPGTQSRTVSDEVPEQAPPLPSFVDRRNEKPGMAEPGQQSKAHAITGDESADIPTPNETTIPPAPLQAPASDGRSASAALQGGMLDARGENEAIKPPIDDPRDQASDKAPMLPSFTDTRRKKTDIEAGQTTIAPHEQPGRRVDKDVGAPAGGSLPMKSQENMNQTYGDGTYTQKLSGDQSKAQPAENKKQGGDETVVTEFGKSKEVDFFADAKQNNTGKDQAISTYGPSTKKMYTDQNESISSEDVVKQTTETVFYRSSATSREIQPPVPEKSMTEQQLQGDKSSISPQDNGKQDFENVPPVSGAEQHNQRELLTNIDRNNGKTPGKTSQKSEEQTSPDTQQVKNNRGNSTLDSSSKPQLDGNQGDFPGSQTGSSSTDA